LLALFSKRLADKQPDWPPQTVLTGFPLYDQDGAPGCRRSLNRFLDDGAARRLHARPFGGDGRRRFYEHSVRRRETARPPGRPRRRQNPRTGSPHCATG